MLHHVAIGRRFSGRIVVPAACLLAFLILPGAAALASVRQAPRPSGLTLGAIRIGATPGDRALEGSLGAGGAPAQRSTFGQPAAGRHIGPHFDATTCVGSNLCYGGGPVLHGATTYVVFWSGAPSVGFSPTYAPAIAGFLQNVAAASGSVNNVYATDGQYGDASGPALDASTWGGSLVDTTPYPTSGCTDAGAGFGSPCLTDAQISAELARVAAAQGWPLGRGSVFFLLTPQGVGSCAADGTCSYQVGGFCAYHSVAGSGSNELVYAAIPYANVAGCRPGGQFPNGGDADPSINTLSHEHNELITDPEGNAWARPNGDENGDLCRTSFVAPLGGAPGSEYNQAIGSGHYYLQSEWSNMINPSGAPPPAGCAASINDQPPVASFAAPASVEPGQAIGLDASGSTGSIVSYSWRFDDGTAPQPGRTIQHAFGAVGQHTVALEVVDALGVPSSLARSVNVVDELPGAAFSVKPGTKPGSQRLDARGSRDPDGTIVSYRWNFGDGTSVGFGAVVAHTYKQRGRHTVTLQISDSGRQSATATQPVTSGAARASSGSPVVARVPTRARLAALLTRGLSLGLRCSTPCRLRLVLVAPSSRVGAGRPARSLGGASLRLGANRSRTLVIHVPGGARSRLAGVPIVTLTVSWLDARGRVGGSARTAIHLTP